MNRASAAAPATPPAVQIVRPRLQLSLLSDLRRAFFRGYMVGSDDERAEHGLTGTRGERAIASNPYPAGAAQRAWWQRGLLAGRKEAR